MQCFWVFFSFLRSSIQTISRPSKQTALTKTFACRRLIAGFEIDFPQFPAENDPISSWRHRSVTAPPKCALIQENGEIRNRFPPPGFFPGGSGVTILGGIRGRWREKITEKVLTWRISDKENWGDYWLLLLRMIFKNETVVHLYTPIKHGLTVNVASTIFFGMPNYSKYTQPTITVGRASFRIGASNNIRQKRVAASTEKRSSTKKKKLSSKGFDASRDVRWQFGLLGWRLPTEAVWETRTL